MFFVARPYLFSSSHHLPFSNMKRSLTIQPSLDQFFRKVAPTHPPPAVPKPTEAKLKPPAPPSPKSLIRSISTRERPPQTEVDEEENKKKKLKREEIITDLSEPVGLSNEIIDETKKKKASSVSFSPNTKDDEVIYFHTNVFPHPPLGWIIQSLSDHAF